MLPENTRKPVPILLYVFLILANILPAALPPVLIMSVTSLWCFYCLLWIYLTSFCSVSIFDFEQVNISWETSPQLQEIDYFNFLPEHYSMVLDMECPKFKINILFPLSYARSVRLTENGIVAQTLAKYTSRVPFFAKLCYFQSV